MAVHDLLLYNNEMDYFIESFDNMTPDQRNAFACQAVDTISTVEMKEEVRRSASRNSDTFRKIENNFTGLTRDLVSIDESKRKSKPLAPRIRTLHERYRDIERQSRDLAVEIAQYNDEFQSLIIPLCYDASISVERRKEVIQEFIDEAETFSKESSNIVDLFNKLKGDTTELAGELDYRIRDREEKDDAEDELSSEIEALQQKWNTCLSIFKGCFATSVIGVLGLYALSIALGPGCIIGALALSTVCVAGEFTSGKLAKSYKEKIGEKQLQRKSKSEAVRDKLGILNKTFRSLCSEISILSKFWDGTRTDARKIKKWLEKGAKIADIPNHMGNSIREAAKIYSQMAVYLREYADGVDFAEIQVS